MTTLQTIQEQLKKLSSEYLQKISSLAGPEAGSVLEQIRVEILGKKGKLSEILKLLGQMDASERPQVGALANQFKAEIESQLESKKQQLDQAKVQAEIAGSKIDVTLPVESIARGTLHPVTQMTRTLIEIFSRIGFDTVIGPEVETDYMNFEAANTPEDHPARDMQDTFYLSPGILLRTQTTSIQARTMRKNKPPIRILSPGAVYRKDHDATHSPMFHQMEGLWIDEGVSFADLKGTLLYFAKELFGKDTEIRMRPSYFPFVEPGAEVDISCFLCAGKDKTCRICKGTGWLEVLGAGMVHPELLRSAGYDTEKVSGFAFGLGIDRLAMIKHQIPDLRLMFSNDVRFLQQF